MAKSIHELFQTETSLEQTGVFVDYGEYGKFKIARAGGSNERYTQVLLTKTQPYRRQIQIQGRNLDQKTVKLIQKLNLEAFIEACLLGWEGVTAKDGSLVPFSKDNASKLAQELPALFEDLQEHANNLATFRLSEIEGDAKN